MSTLPAAIPDTSIPLKGTYVTLENFSHDHIDSLWRHLDLHGKGAGLLDYLPWPQPDSAEAFWTLLHEKQVNRGVHIYAIKADPQHVNPKSGDNSHRSHSETVGIIAYFDVKPVHRELELGAIVFGSVLQRSAAATEVIFLMLQNVCDASPMYRRITWKCNSLNGASRRAAERIGFKYEGTSRNHQIINGRSRDSDWLSMIDSEWPVIKAALEQWLLEENFDGAGRQIRTLDEIRADLNGS